MRRILTALVLLCLTGCYESEPSQRQKVEYDAWERREMIARAKATSSEVHWWHPRWGDTISGLLDRNATFPDGSRPFAVITRHQGIWYMPNDPLLQAKLMQCYQETKLCGGELICRVKIYYRGVDSHENKQYDVNYEILNTPEEIASTVCGAIGIGGIMLFLLAYFIDWLYWKLKREK